MKKIRIRAKEKNGIVTVKAMIKHPMLSYVQAKKKHKKANFITYIIAKVNGEPVYEVSTSQFLSKNPFIKFQFRGKKGEKLEITAKDLSGDSITTIKKIR